MVFSSLFFLYVFLPLNLVLYRLMPTIRAKNVLMTVFSLIFYAWGEPVYVFLLLGMTFADWLLAQYVGSRARRSTAAKWGVAATCLVNLGLLAVFKYGTFFMENTHNLLGFPDQVVQIALPIGISFYTFQLLSYVVDVYRGEVEPQRSFPTLLLYVSLFHQCIAGPIVRYKDINHELLERRATRSDVSYGITRFTVGLAKKAVLANACGSLADQLLVADKTPTAEALQTISGQPTLALWVGALAFMLQIYLDFSAYSDMAIGMGRMIGFHYRENFNYPYMSLSITDFWRRWHISLSSFFRDYVYIPLGGNRCGKGRVLFNLFVVWALTGFWHGASWNYMCWGLVLLRVSGAGAHIPAPRAGAPAPLCGPCLRPCGGVFRLGAVQVHRLFRAGRGAGGHVRLHGCARLHLRGCLADPQQSADSADLRRGLHAYRALCSQEAVCAQRPQRRGLGGLPRGSRGGARDLAAAGHHVAGGRQL